MTVQWLTFTLEARSSFFLVFLLGMFFFNRCHFYRIGLFFFLALHYWHAADHSVCVCVCVCVNHDKYPPITVVSFSDELYGRIGN